MKLLHSHRAFLCNTVWTILTDFMFSIKMLFLSQPISLNWLHTIHSKLCNLLHINYRLSCDGCCDNNLMTIQYICKFPTGAIKMMLPDALLIYCVSIATEAEVRAITANFKNFNSLRRIKVKDSFEVDQGTCKWDLDLYRVQRIAPVPPQKV